MADPDAATLYRLTLSQMLAAIDAGHCTASDLVESCLVHMAMTEASVGAWVHLEDRAQWLERWRNAEARYRHLPFKGLLIGIKDTIDVAGMPSERGSPIWSGRIAEEDAA